MNTALIHRLIVFSFLSIIFTSCGEEEDSQGNGNGGGNGSGEDFTCELLADELALPNSTGIFGLGHITINDESVFIYTYSDADGGTIHSFSIVDGTEIIVAGGLAGVNNIMLDGLYIYWLEYEIEGGSGMVKRAKISGNEDAEVLAEGKPKNPDGSTSDYDVYFPNGLTISDGYLYWGEEVGGSAIRKISVDGGAVTDIGRGDDLKPWALNADADNIYVLDAVNGTQLVQYAKSDGTMTVLTSGFSSVQAFSNLELNDNTLYWTETTDEGKVFSFDLSEATFSIIKEGDMTNPRSVIVENSNIYVGAANGVFYIQADGTEVSAACSNITVPFTIAVDEDFIYIVDKPNTAATRGQIVMWTND